MDQATAGIARIQGLLLTEEKAVTRADTLQYELGQGPCLTAWAMEETVIVQDVTTDPRWREWSDAVKGMPILSVISTPLIAEQECIAA